MSCFRILQRMMLSGVLLPCFLVSLFAYGGHAMDTEKKTDFTVVPFGSGGQLKMIYDRRQRPQAIYMNGKVYIGYNGGAPLDATEREKTYPFVIALPNALRSGLIPKCPCAPCNENLNPVIISSNINTAPLSCASFCTLCKKLSFGGVSCTGSRTTQAIFPLFSSNILPKLVTGMCNLFHLLT